MSNRMARIFKIIFILSGISMMGDIFLAYIWNATIIPTHPSIGMLSFGILSSIGLFLGALINPIFGRMKTPLKVLTIGFIIRIFGVSGFLIFSAFIPRGIIVGASVSLLTDFIVNVFTAGIIFSIVSNHTEQEEYVSLVAFGQVFNQMGIILAWVVSGFLFSSIGTIGLIVVDIITFIPLLISLFAIQRVINEKTTANENGNNAFPTTTFEFSSTIVLTLMFVVFIVGSFVSRTTSLLYSKIFDNASSFFNVQGILFAIYVSGYMLSNIFISNKRIVPYISKLYKLKVSILVLPLLMGGSLSVLPLLQSQVIFFYIGLFIAGFFTGFIPSFFASKIKRSFPTEQQARGFHLYGIISKYSESIGTALGGALLSIISVAGLYFMVGIIITFFSVIAMILYREKQNEP
jgi:MFS family permease